MPSQSSFAEKLSVVMLVVVVFVCGFALMALEMVGPRILARDFGSGIYVWGSVISIFLLALSLGYWLGGTLSVWRPRPWVLASVILSAGALFALIPFIDNAVSGEVFDLDLPDRWGALLCATTLFLVPSVLLGMVSPFTVRLATRDVKRSGAVAGLLYSISTLGSFLGCIVTSFYFVLWLDIPMILWCMAGALGAAAVLCWLMPMRRLETP